MKRRERCPAFSAVAVAAVLFVGIGTARAQETRTDHDHGLEGQTLKIWQDFLQHVESIGKAEVIPPAYLEQLKAPAGDEGEEHDEHEHEHDEHDHDHGTLVNLRSSDPIKGILFRLSGDLLDVDALFEENAGTLPEEKIPEARARVEKLVALDDPYLEDYGKLFQARIDLQEEKFEDALAVLKSLSLSTRLLPIPAREVQHGLVQANRALGDDTMAILELQLLLSTLPPEEIAERTWAKEQLKEIRKEHDGPLKATGESMLSISELLAGDDVGATTQKEQRRVEEVFEKVVKIFEAERCPSCGTPKCPDCGQRQCSCPGGTWQSAAGGTWQGSGAGSGSGRGRGQQTAQGQGQQNEGENQSEDGRPRGNSANESPANDTTITAGEGAGEVKLREVSPEEREAWGRINDREVARSLRELWDKIPPSYRLSVTRYFADVSAGKAPEAPAESEDAKSGDDE